MPSNWNRENTTSTMTLDGYVPVEETLIVAAGDAQLERQLTLATLTPLTPTPPELTPPARHLRS